MKLPFTSWQPEDENVKPSNLQKTSPPKVEAKKPSLHIKQGQTGTEKNEELRAKLDGASVEAREAGVELEDEKAVGLKRE